MNSFFSISLILARKAFHLQIRLNRVTKACSCFVFGQFYKGSCLYILCLFLLHGLSPANHKHGWCCLTLTREDWWGGRTPSQHHERRLKNLRMGWEQGRWTLPREKRGTLVIDFTAMWTSRSNEIHSRKMEMGTDHPLKGYCIEKSKRRFLIEPTKHPFYFAC